MTKSLSQSEYFKHQISSIINIHKIVTLNYFEFDSDLPIKENVIISGSLFMLIKESSP